MTDWAPSRISSKLEEMKKPCSYSWSDCSDGFAKLLINKGTISVPEASIDPIGSAKKGAPKRLWPSTGSAGTYGYAYSTSMAIIALTPHLQLLPIYQR